MDSKTEHRLGVWWKKPDQQRPQEFWWSLMFNEIHLSKQCPATSSPLHPSNYWIFLKTNNPKKTAKRLASDPIVSSTFCVGNAFLQVIWLHTHTCVGMDAWINSSVKRNFYASIIVHSCRVSVTYWVDSNVVMILTVVCTCWCLFPAISGLIKFISLFQTARWPFSMKCMQVRLGNKAGKTMQHSITYIWWKQVPSIKVHHSPAQKQI